MLAGPLAAWGLFATLIAFSWWTLAESGSFYLTIESAESLIGFAIGGGLIIYVVGKLATANKRAASALRRLGRERERLSLALSAAKAGAWERAPDGTVIWDQTFYDLIGLNPSTDQPSAELFLSSVHPDDRAKATADVNAGVGGKPPARSQYRVTKPDGNVIYVETFRSVLPSEEEEGVHLLGVTQDVTQRRTDEERLSALLREVSHRVKNQFAVILGVINAVGRRSGSVEAFRQEVASRIYGMSRAHDLLVAAEWRGASLAEVIRAQLEPFAIDSRWGTAGPDVLLLPSAVQHLSMAFFELATNAVKYGAFSVPSGRVDVSWRILAANGGDKPTLELIWLEKGKGSLEGDVWKGFGTTVLERVAPQGLGGIGVLNREADGLSWRLTATEALVLTPQTRH
jgi:two-component sensor histidine kinase